MKLIKFTVTFLIILFIFYPLQAKLFDAMETKEGWSVGGENGTTTSLDVADGINKKALAFSYEFTSGSWTQIERSLTEDLTKFKAIKFQLKGEGTANNLQLKIEDADGTTYGKNFEGVTSNDQWQTVIIPLVDLTYFWGGDNILDLKNMSKLYFAVCLGSGGKGKILIDQMEFLDVIPKDASAFERKYVLVKNEVLDAMEVPTGWMIGGENDAMTSLSVVPGEKDKAVRCDYDFKTGKWLQMQKGFNLDISQNKKISFFLKGEGAKNNFQFKIEDADGSVFGMNYEKILPLPAWKKIEIPLTSLQYFWGGDKVLDLKKIVKMFFVGTASDGSKGSIVIDELQVE